MRDYVQMKPEFIKIWVDDRDGQKKTLTPALYGAILDEAHKANVPVAVHNVKLSDAKQMVKGGMEGWLHVPVRGGDVVDNEMIALVKDRIARNDRPFSSPSSSVRRRLERPPVKSSVLPRQYRSVSVCTSTVLPHRYTLERLGALPVLPY